VVARVIVNDLQTRERGDDVERSARIRWDGGDFRLFVSTPARLAAPADEATGFVCAALLPAMRLGEDIEVREGVSKRLLDRLPRIVDVYATWDPRLHRSRVRAERELGPRSAARGVGCFFSRGVDSMHSAAVPRGLPGTLTELVHCDRLEPKHSEAVRVEEIRLAGEAARELRLPLVVIETNVRELTDPIVADWADMVGGGLALLAHAMAGGFGHVVIPSSAAPTTVIPTGSSPMLDGMFSTDELEVYHDAPATRPAKVAWLARERPELLPYLKVCFHEDRSDNCGRCPKCLATMLSLEAAGALGLATGFPREIDRAALAELDVSGLQPREEFREIEWRLGERGADPLAGLVADALRRGAVGPPDGELRTDSPAFLARAERDARRALGSQPQSREAAP
jgi:hypothetical protein